MELKPITGFLILAVLTVISVFVIGSEEQSIRHTFGNMIWACGTVVFYESIRGD